MAVQLMWGRARSTRERRIVARVCRARSTRWVPLAIWLARLPVNLGLVQGPAGFPCGLIVRLGDRHWWFVCLAPPRRPTRYGGTR
jgi:hypothetical protein